MDGWGVRVVFDKKSLNIHYSVTKVEETSHFASGPPHTPFDLAVELAPTAGGRAIRLVVEAQERVSPLLAIGILQRMTESLARGVPTLCSRVISERVAELCRSQGVSSLDEVGNCRLPASAPYKPSPPQDAQPIHPNRGAEDPG